MTMMCVVPSSGSTFHQPEVSQVLFRHLTVQLVRCLAPPNFISACVRAAAELNRPVFLMKSSLINIIRAQ